MESNYFKYRVWDEEDKKYVSELVFVNHCGEICLIEDGALYKHECTIERCTGIKDMYQNFIYQNDIVRTNTPCYGEPELKVIRWEDCYAGHLLTACDFPSGYCDFYGGLTFDQESASEYVTVIGNIHDEKLKEVPVLQFGCSAETAAKNCIALGKEIFGRDKKGECP